MPALRFLIAALSIIAAVATASAARIPDFTFTTDHGPLRLEDLRGKVVYLDYWASWCGPCRETFPFMNELQARYRDKDFVVIAVSIDKDPAAARRFLAKYPANFVVAYDTEGTTAKTLRVQGNAARSLRRTSALEKRTRARSSAKSNRCCPPPRECNGGGASRVRVFNQKSRVNSRRYPRSPSSAPAANLSLPPPVRQLSSRRLSPP
jgi:thiol-disulfide isomerase/thioredoxin